MHYKFSFYLNSPFNLSNVGVVIIGKTSLSAGIRSKKHKISISFIFRHLTQALMVLVEEM